MPNVSRFATLALALMLPGIFALAFDEAEHRRVSNDAMAAVIRCVEGSDGDRDTQFVSRDPSLKTLKAFQENASYFMSYGRLVSSADYITGPLELLWQRGVALEGPDAVDWRGIFETRRSFWQFVVATKYDDEHFGARALFGAWYWHRMALERARDGNLVEALVINSYADHLLQDFHAPGHVATPKNGEADAIALVYHDTLNKLGRLFRPINLRALKPLLDTICEQQTDGCNTLQRWAAPWEGQAEVYGPTPAAPEQVAALMHRRVTPTALENEFTFYGDGGLHKNATERVFLTVLTARSILDVVCSYEHAEVENSFLTRRWDSEARLPVLFPHEMDLPTVCHAFGCFDHAHAEKAVWAIGAIELNVSGLTLLGNGGTAFKTRFEVRGLTPLSFGEETKSDRDDQRDRKTPSWMSLGYNYQAGAQAGTGSCGYGLRYTKGLGRTNLQYSLGTEFDAFPCTWGGRWRPGGDVTLQSGFGIAFVGISATRGYLRRSDGSLANVWGVSSGVSFQGILEAGYKWLTEKDR